MPGTVVVSNDTTSNLFYMCPPLNSTAIPFANADTFSLRRISEHAFGNGIIAASCKPQGWDYTLGSSPILRLKSDWLVHSSVLYKNRRRGCAIVRLWLGRNYSSSIPERSVCSCWCQHPGHWIVNLSSFVLKILRPWLWTHTSESWAFAHQHVD